MNKQSHNAGDWGLGTELGLRPDGGWINALQNILSESTTDGRQAWEGLLRLAAEAKARTGSDWVQTQQETDYKCSCETGLPNQPPHPVPGTATYQETLLQCAPDEGWLERVRQQVGVIGEEPFAAAMAGLYQRTMQDKPGSLNRKAPKREILRAMIWFALATPAAPMIHALGQLACWSVENKTAQAATIGIVLAAIPMEEVAGALRMVEMSAKRPSPKIRFARLATHVERTVGITAEESAERFVPSFGLDTQGRFHVDFGEHGAVEVAVEGSKSALHFKDAAGAETTRAATTIKREYAAELKELRAATKGLDQLLGAQKQRLESLLSQSRSWPLSVWRERYLSHPVVGVFARRLVWILDGIPVVFADGHAADVRGKSVPESAGSEITLWHPLGKPVAEVMAWRERLEELNVQQPFKQAHREIYLLTDAERSTMTYSNRFAGHILRQSQFRALAAGRLWTAPFLGGWDGGDGGAVSHKLPDNWRVEFWVNAIGEQYGPSGGLLHISTDQVRFYLGAQGEPAPLHDVPALIFSEAMRDVDLFVGVASVANDPTWSDGGPEGRHRQYWRDVAFGELGASAAIRREILQQLIPKLKIADLCSFTDRYLVVKGTKHTYRIHMGSGNILMEPNGQYLCIVADRRLAAEWTDFFLPFEGDQMLSLIISKAFLLAEDEKISDPTITRQIDGK